VLSSLNRFRPVLLAGLLWLALSTATRIALALRPDVAQVANYQSLGYLRGDRLVLLSPKRKAEVFSADRRWNAVEPVSDPAVLREAIAFYSAASFVFRNGLYRDEEQTPPEQRADLARVR
jgi:hypothetical protein